jgi:signal transduction histidine kinase
VVETVAAEAHSLATTLRDWSVWDETYAFAANVGNGYSEKNLTHEEFRTLSIESVSIIDPAGIIRFSKGVSPRAVLPVGTDIHRILPRFNARQIATEKRVVAWGLVGGVPSLIGAGEIAPSTGAAPSRGSLLFIRQMTPPRLAALGKRAGVEFQLRPINGVLQDQRAIVRDGVISGRVTLRGPAGNARFALGFDTPRHFSQVGAQTIRNTSIILAAASLILCAAGAFFIVLIVARPLQRIARQMQAIAASGALNQRLGMSRRDEIGVVANGLDNMVAELKEAREKLEVQTYQSGMADLAAGVLHNVRNVLAPIFTSLWSAEQRLKEARSERLFQALTALKDDTIAPERRAKLLTYVEASLRDITGKNDDARTECANVKSLAEQIEMILKEHDKVSHAERPQTQVELAGVVDDALRQVAWNEHKSVEVVQDDSLRQAQVTTQRVILLQVIGNVVKNAVEAVERTASRRGRIVISWSESGGQGELHIADTGIGIAPEQKASLFSRGYSTNTDRQGGIGLHWCANALRAMGGSIRLESEGAGKGAVAIISLPGKSPAEELAA